jgi:5-formyltetrahydrofolate cyclo-ligase
VPTWSLLDQLGERAVFPRVERGSRVLQFHQVATRSLLVPRGRLQLLEPPGDAPVVPLLDIDLFVVPGVAFSPDGRRLGRGGGYYDQTLALAPNALAVGVAFECCVEDDVPVDPHDRLVDALVTESRTLVLQRRR